MVAGDLYGDLAGERADSSHRTSAGPTSSMCGELTDDDVMLRYDGEPRGGNGLARQHVAPCTAKDSVWFGRVAAAEVLGSCCRGSCLRRARSS